MSCRTSYLNVADSFTSRAQNSYFARTNSEDNVGAALLDFSRALCNLNFIFFRIVKDNVFAVAVGISENICTGAALQRVIALAAVNCIVLVSAEYLISFAVARNLNVVRDGRGVDCFNRGVVIRGGESRLAVSLAQDCRRLVILPDNGIRGRRRIVIGFAVLVNVGDGL